MTAAPTLRNTDFFFLVTRLLLGFIYFSSGVNKLAGGQFAHLIGPPDLIAEMAARGYALLGYIVAVSQVVIGMLVLSQRYSLLGLIGLFPLCAGIFLYTVLEGWRGTPYVNLGLLTLVISALLYEWHTAKALWSNDLTTVQPSRAAVFFPDNLPAVGFLLGALLLGYGATVAGPSTLGAVGVLLYGALGAYVCTRPVYVNKLQRTTVLCFFLAIVTLTLGIWWTAGVMLLFRAFLAITLIGFVSFLISFFRRR